MGLLLAAGLAACSSGPQQMSSETSNTVVAASPPVVAAEVSSSQSRMAPNNAKAASTLGTQWGEGRESVAESVNATRLNPERPQALAQMRYSDETSIRRALGRNADRQLSVLLANGDVEWSVQDGEGRALPIFSTRGGTDYQVAGRHGERYELVYVNRTNRNYEIVATVDGLDVMTGQTGSMRNDGYLLRPGEKLRIDGFRKNQREVAAFRFSNKDRAYANNTAAGDPRNVGVIGVALFEVRVDSRNSEGRRPRPPQMELGDPRAFPADPVRPYAPAPQYRK